MKYEELPNGLNRLLEEESVLIDIPGKVLSEFIDIKAHRLTVRKGYIWDGASGCTIDTLATERAALFHDALYELMREERLPQRYKATADALLRNLMVKDRQTPLGFIRAWYYWAGVWAFGAKHCAPDNTSKT